MRKIKYLTLLSIIITQGLYAQEMTFEWVKVWDGENGSNIRTERMALDGQNNIYVGSRVIETADVDPGTGVYTVQKTKKEAVAYIKFTPDGEFVRAAVLEADDKIRTESMVADSAGNLFATGYFSDTLFAEVSGVPLAYPSTSQNWDAFLAKINAEGQIEWIFTYGGMYDDKGNGCSYYWFGR